MSLLFSLFSPLASKALGFLGGWIGYLAIAVALIGFGSFLGYKVEATIASVSISQIQHQYDDYKLVNETDRLKTTQAVVEEINLKNKKIQQLTSQLQKTTMQLQQDSTAITKVLNTNEASLNAVHLSRSSLDYLSELRNLQQTNSGH